MCKKFRSISGEYNCRLVRHSSLFNPLTAAQTPQIMNRAAVAKKRKQKKRRLLVFLLLIPYKILSDQYLIITERHSELVMPISLKPFSPPSLLYVLAFVAHLFTFMRFSKLLYLDNFAVCTNFISFISDVLVFKCHPTASYSYDPFMTLRVIHLCQLCIISV